MDVLLPHRGDEFADVLVFVPHQDLRTHDVPDPQLGRIASVFLPATEQARFIEDAQDLIDDLEQALGN